MSSITNVPSLVSRLKTLRRVRVRVRQVQSIVNNEIKTAWFKHCSEFAQGWRIGLINPKCNYAILGKQNSSINIRAVNLCGRGPIAKRAPEYPGHMLMLRGISIFIVYCQCQSQEF